MVLCPASDKSASECISKPKNISIITKRILMIIATKKAVEILLIPWLCKWEAWELWSWWLWVCSIRWGMVWFTWCYREWIERQFYILMPDSRVKNVTECVLILIVGGSIYKKMRNGILKNHKEYTSILLKIRESVNILLCEIMKHT